MSLTAAHAASDVDLLHGIAGGDPIALGALYDRYAADVWRVVCRAVGASADADVVVHATFLHLWRVAGRLDRHASCDQWLRGNAVRLALRHDRGTGRRYWRMVASLRQALRGASGAGRPERDPSEGDEQRTLERALARIHPEMRAAFVLVELEGFTTQQAAEVLEVPLAKVRMRLSKARSALQVAIERSTSAAPMRTSG